MKADRDKSGNKRKNSNNLKKCVMFIKSKVKSISLYHKLIRSQICVVGDFMNKFRLPRFLTTRDPFKKIVSMTPEEFSPPFLS